ncbi:MAG: tetratricopeptide repeat protein [Phycisphaerae bacterium]|nr:tetratricopeptide repeat protein [Phycisphaerae bacterium]
MRYRLSGINCALPWFACLFTSTFSCVVLGAEEPDAAQPRSSTAPVTDDEALRTYYAGNGLLNRGLFDLAAEEYQRFLSRWPEHEKAITARYGLAVSLFRLDRCSAALPELEMLKQAEDLPYAAEVAVMLGQCRSRAGDFAGAVKAYETVLTEHPKHQLADDAALGAAEASHRLHRKEDVLRFCTIVQRDHNRSALRNRCDLLGAQALSQLNRDREAVRLLSELRQRNPEGELAAQAELLEASCLQRLGEATSATPLYRRVIESARDDLLPEALFGLGSILSDQGNTDEAAELFDRLLSANPESSLAPAARMVRARLYFDAGDYDDAVALWGRSLDAGGESADEAAYWLGKCRLRQERYADAAGLLEKALDRFPASDLRPQMMYDRAVALSRSGDTDAAAAVGRRFREAFAGHELEPDMLYLLAGQAYRQGEIKTAQEAAQEIVEKHADHALAVGARMLVAECAYQQGEFAKAAEQYELVLATSPDETTTRLGRYHLGMSLYRLERFDDAVEALTPVADRAAQTGEHRAAQLTLGDIHVCRSEWKQAESRLRQYLADGMDVPSADDALFKLGLSLQRQGRTEEALACYESFLATFAESPLRTQVMFERGQMLLALDRLDEAAEAMEQTLRNDKEGRFSNFARKHLASIAMRKGEYARAADEYGRLTEDGSAESNAARVRRGEALLAARQYEPALVLFSEVLTETKTQAESAPAAAGRAIALSRLDRYDAALAAISETEKEHADRLDPATRRALRYEKAWCLRRSGRTDEAESTYRALLATDGDGPQANHARLALAAMLMDRKEFASARQLLGELDQRIKGNADDGLREQVLYRLGVCDHELDRHEEARSQLTTFVGRYPRSAMLAPALYLLGASAAQLNNHEEAVRAWRRVVDEFPDHELAATSQLRAAESLLALQRWAAAEQGFSVFLDRHPGHAQQFQAQFGLGWARENQQRYDDAIKAYSAVIQNHQGPTSARAQFQVGECLFAQKKYEDAIKELLKVDILYAYAEWSAAALYEAGRCFELLGRSAEARGQFQAVTERFADTKWSNLARERLEAKPQDTPPGR